MIAAVKKKKRERENGWEKTYPAVLMKGTLRLKGFAVLW